MPAVTKREGHAHRNSFSRPTRELDRNTKPDETGAVPNDPHRPGRPRRALAALFAATLLQAGCGVLLLAGGAGTSAIAFATGELRVTENVPMEQLHEATRIAVETLRYVDVEAVLESEGDRIRWRATTAGGDPVDIRLIARGDDQTDLRIRIGVFGNEARSRLVLEQIRQAL